MITSSPLISASTPLKGTNKQDWSMHNDSKAKTKHTTQKNRKIHKYICSWMALSMKARSKNQRHETKYQYLNHQEFQIFHDKWKECNNKYNKKTYRAIQTML